MVELQELKGPVQCPFCLESLTEIQFLKRFISDGEAPLIIGGLQAVFECDRCHSIYGVKNE